MFSVSVSPRRAAVLALCVALSPVPAFGAPIEPISWEEASDLSAGHYIWRPQLASDGPVEVVISLAQQRAYVFRDGTLIGYSTISSGAEGYDSPVGRFKILQKARTHRSNRYSNAPMPYMQRLNWNGVALHGGVVPDYPASHGCIRLPIGFAKALYEATSLGGFVYVTHADFASPDEGLDLARSHADDPLTPSRDFAEAVRPEEPGVN